jgi:superfamily II DNA or RNA helicase
MLRELRLKSVYRTEDDNLLEDFYLPVLGVANSYDRAVGFFSAAMLSYAAQGLSAFVRNDGKMRLIIGGELDRDDEAAMREGYNMREVLERFGLKIIETIDRVDDALLHRRIEALAWLIACGRLDIKIAFRKKGMYHEKIGIFRDSDGDAIVFQGSANETANALLPDFNFESINVFPCWKEELSGHFTPYLDGFEKLWRGESKNTRVMDFPEAARQKLIRIAQQGRVPSPDIEVEIVRAARRSEGGDAAGAEFTPRIPNILNGREFKMERHQLDALVAWKAGNFQGILAHATGSGKTITSIYGAVRVFESTKGLILGIAVPYQNLADQWVATLTQFNINAVSCYGGRDRWFDELSRRANLYQAGAINFLSFVVVNRTLLSSEFQGILKQFPAGNLMWIGDECHHHSSRNLSAALPANAKMRLGLSATPEHYIDEVATQRLTDYYGKIVSTFTLAQALDARVITPYQYHVSVVKLTEEEAMEYIEISEKIAQLSVMRQSDDAESASDEQLRTLLAKRSRIIGTAREKLAALRAILSGFKPTPFTLFYCGDGSVEDDVSGEVQRHVEQVSGLLYDQGWVCSHFTSREPREDRQTLIDKFRLGNIDALVAIRCLDEGIDVPACRTAFILASSRNPKQFIQRRGRILRRSEGKQFAVIYDFVVSLPYSNGESYGFERKLICAELERVAEFARLAMNSADSIRSLGPLLSAYDLAHVLV